MKTDRTTISSYIRHKLSEFINKHDFDQILRYFGVLTNINDEFSFLYTNNTIFNKVNIDKTFPKIFFKKLRSFRRNLA